MSSAAKPEVKIIYSKAGIEIVTKPFLVGEELAALSKRCSMDFIQALPADTTDVVSLEILNGGRYYYVASAFKEVHGVECPVSTLHAKRRCENGKWMVRVWDKGGADLGDFQNILIGDTIATGTTLCGTIASILDEIAAANKPLPNLHIWTIAGSIDVVEHPQLLEVAERLHKAGKKMYLYFANARFNLNKNGTDLQFFDADYNPEAKAEITSILGDFSSKMKCAVWDWGDRFRENEIPNHLHEIQEYYTGAGAPDWLLEGIKQRIDAQEAKKPSEAKEPTESPAKKTKTSDTK